MMKEPVAGIPEVMMANKSEEWDEVFDRITKDYAELGGIALVLRPRLNGSMGEVYSHPVSYVRVGDDNHPDLAYSCANWKCYTDKQFTPQTYIRFNQAEYDKDARNYVINSIKRWKELTKKGTEEFPGFMLYIKKYGQNAPYYGRPSWEPAAPSAYVDAQIQVFHGSNMDNDFNPSLMLFHPGFTNLDGKNPDGETKTEAIKRKIAGWQGAKNGGKIFNLFGPTQESAPVPIPLSSNGNHELYLELDKQIEKKIARSMNQPPVLAGILTAGQLGTSQEIWNAAQMYNSAVISRVHKFISRILAPLIASQFGADRNQVKKNLTISNAMPLAYINPEFANNFTQDEIREASGYNPLPQTTSTSIDQVLKSINTLSPLVANKVLESMTADEIRQLVTLPALTEEQRKELTEADTTFQAPLPAV